MEPIFVLLRETEDIILPCELLEPPPTEIPELSLSTDPRSNSPLGDSARNRPEKWANKSGPANMYVQNVVISVTDTDQKKKGKEKKVKEQPVWMMKSTILEAPPDAPDTSLPLDMPSVTDENDNKEDPNADSEVFRTLLIHESKSTGPGLPPVSKSSRSDSESDTSESEEEKKQTKADGCKPTANSDIKPQDDDDEEEDEEEEQETLDPTLMVAGQPHLYSEVSQNPQLVSFMTDEERESYIKVGQQMFQSAFE